MEYLEELIDLRYYDILHKIKCEKDAIVWSGFEKGPDYEQYKKYVQDRIINDPKNHLFFLMDNENVIGYCQFVEQEDGCFEGRGSGILKEYQGCGYAQDMGKLFLEKAKEMGCKFMFSWCSERNKPSVYALLSSGWEKTEEKNIIYMPAFKEEHVFFKWVKEL